MTSPQTLLEVERALDASALELLREEMRAPGGEDAGVLGAGPDERVASSARRATRVEVSDAAHAAVTRVLERERPRVEAHFGRPLDGCEEPQFLRYGPGDYFVAHQDGNTPLLHDRSRFRRVSVVLFVSELSAYGGGLLVLHGPPRVRVAADAGRLVAFPAEATHEVTPVTHGERLSIVAWYRHGG